MGRYVCIHGHFYQPPRENPWLETTQVQDSAYPYHDWNERITAECYAPNSESRILDDADLIVEIVNNYSRISFNLGPTLLAWMETAAPEVYLAMLEADKESQRRFSGHGSAMAQAYNHIIMPLANHRDKYTQVIWGIRDFQNRFGRDPEGMWLPETAVDIETLEVLAEQGMGFTVLAPHQASRVRPLEESDWQDVSGGSVDIRIPYSVALPSGRTICVFFYDGPLSRAVAFEGLLHSGDAFSQALIDGFSDDRQEPQLVHIATDGETYGHHHRHGDMALASALHIIEGMDDVSLTNYGEYLERHPPTHEAEIVENSSWSCVHGIERWRSNCGCNSGGRPRWNQGWRGPLRGALDELRDTLASPFEERAGALLTEPWTARDEYIDLVLQRTPERLDEFLSAHASKSLLGHEAAEVLKLMELQRHSMLMYTSCGWFFDELSGIETVQVLQYAGRSFQLAQELFGASFTTEFLELLSQVKSNLPEHADGRRIYEKWVRPASVDLTTVAAHYSASSLFEDYPAQTEVHCYLVDCEDCQRQEAGRTTLAIGRARITSKITTESGTFSFAAVHFGDHTLNAGVRRYGGTEEYQEMVRAVTGAFESGDLPNIIRQMDGHFGTSNYSLSSLFRDEQRKVLSKVLESMLGDAEALYRQVYDSNYALMGFLAEQGDPLPRPFRFAAEFVINTDLESAIVNGGLISNAERITMLLEDAKRWQVRLDEEGLGYLLERNIGQMMAAFAQNPNEVSRMSELDRAIEIAESIPFEVDLRRTQNLFYKLVMPAQTGSKAAADQEATDTENQATLLKSLAARLSIRLD